MSGKVPRSGSVHYRPPVASRPVRARVSNETGPSRAGCVRVCVCLCVGMRLGFVWGSSVGVRTRVCLCVDNYMSGPAGDCAEGLSLWVCAS